MYNCNVLILQKRLKLTHNDRERESPQSSQTHNRITFTNNRSRPKSSRTTSRTFFIFFDVELLLFPFYRPFLFRPYFNATRCLRVTLQVLTTRHVLIYIFFFVIYHKLSITRTETKNVSITNPFCIWNYSLRTWAICFSSRVH